MSKHFRDFLVSFISPVINDDYSEENYPDTIDTPDTTNASSEATTPVSFRRSIIPPFILFYFGGLQLYFFYTILYHYNSRYYTYAFLICASLILLFGIKLVIHMNISFIETIPMTLSYFVLLTCVRRLKTITTIYYYNQTHDLFYPNTYGIDTIAIHIIYCAISLLLYLLPLLTHNSYSKKQSIIPSLLETTLLFFAIYELYKL